MVIAHTDIAHSRSQTNLQRREISLALPMNCCGGSFRTGSDRTAAGTHHKKLPLILLTAAPCWSVTGWRKGVVQCTIQSGFNKIQFIYIWIQSVGWVEYTILRLREDRVWSNCDLKFCHSMNAIINQNASLHRNMIWGQREHTHTHTHIHTRTHAHTHTHIY